MTFNFFSDHASEIIALCALFLTIYQSFLQRKNARISVRPHITSFTEKDRNDKEARISGYIKNNGLGPAFIEKFEVFLDGKSMETERAFKMIFKGFDGKQQSYTSFDIDYAIPPDEAHALISYTFPCSSQEKFDKVLKHFDRLDFKLTYKCGYGKRRTWDSRKKGNDFFHDL